MRKIYGVLFILFFGVPFLSWAQVSGDFRTAGSGTWSTAGTWQRYNGSTWDASGSGSNNPGQVPSSTSSVWIQSGHTVTLGANASCNDLHIANSTTSSLGTQGKIALATFTLSVNGKMRTYWAAVNTIPGTSSTSGFSVHPFTASSGKVSIVGNSRSLTVSGEWGATISTPATGTFPLEINLNSGQTATINNSIKCTSLSVITGTLDASTFTIGLDNGTTGQGDLSVSSGAVLSSQATAVVQRTGTTKGGTFTVDGTLKLTAASPTIAMNAINFTGSVEYARAAIQTLAVLANSGASPNTYTNLILSGTNAKTLGVNTTVNGILSMQGTASLALGSFGLTYGSSSTLEYASSTANQTTTSTEFPSSGSVPPNLKINNTFGGTGVTLHAARSISGTLTLSNGFFNTTSFLLTLTNVANTAISGGTTTSYIKGPITWTLGSSSSGTYTVPVGASAYYPFAFAAGSIASGSPTINVQATTATPGTADGTTLTSTGTTEYWTLATTGATFSASSFSIARSSGTGAFDVIGKSTTNGATSYSSIGGSTGTLSGQSGVLTSSSGLSGAGTLYLALSKKVDNYTVTYFGNTNTSGTAPTDASSPYTPGTSVMVLGNTGSLVKTGYSFAGWNTAADGSGTGYAAGATFNIGANTSLYAQWTATVSYDGNSNDGGTAPTDATAYLPGATVTVKTNSGSLTRTGYTFAGWNTAANGSGTTYTAGTGTFAMAGNITLYAKWTATVTYDGNTNTSGSAPTDATAYLPNATVTVLSNSGGLVKTGYVFSGWNTAADGSGTTYTAGTGTFTLTGNITLYALWVLATVPTCPASTAVTPSGTQSICQGITAGQLTAAITTAGGAGTPTLLYQWYYNTSNSNTVAGATTVTGETNNTFTPPTTSSEAGTTRYYFCVGYATDNTCGQTNATQSLASNAVQVTVNALPTDPSTFITVSANPSCGPATLSYTSPGFYWETSTSDFTIAGRATTSNYTLGATGTIYVRAYNGTCWSTNTVNTGSVTVNSIPSDPTGSIGISANPSCGTATLTYTTGYYWETSAGDFTTAGRGTSSSYSLAATGTIYVRAYNGSCWSTNAINTGTVTVNSIPSDPTGTVTAAANPACGSTTVSYSAPNAAIYWQTSSNGTSTASPTTSTFPVSVNNTTVYVRAYNGTCWSAVGSSNTGSITINTVPTTPGSSTPAAVCEGTAVTITGAGSTGATTYTYWTASGGGTQYTTGSPAGYTVSGGNLTTPTSLTAGSYTYYIQGETATCTSAARQSVTITINTVPATPGGTVTAAANPACGSTTVSYSAPNAAIYWQTASNGTSTASPTTSTFPVSVTNTTVYVRAYNGSCWSAVGGSNTGSITINANTSITTPPSNVSVALGSSASFTVAAAGTGTLTYQWRKNGTDISGATSATYTIPSVAAGDAATYDVVVTGTCGSATSSGATLTISAITYVTNDYQSATGTGLLWSTAAHWRKYNGSGWNAYGADGTPSSTRNVFIQGEMSTNGSITINDVTILDGGVLTISAASTANGNVLVKKNGVLNINPGRFTVGSAASGKNFEVEDSGTVNIHYKYGASGSGDPTATIWKANEIFHPLSFFVVQDWNNSSSDYFTNLTSDISTYTNGSYSACFGYLIIDMWETASTANFALMPSGFNKNLTHKDLVFRSSGPSNYKVVFSDAGFSTTIGGNLVIESNFLKSVSLLNNSGTVTLNIKGNIIHDGSASLKLCGTGNASNTASLTMNVDSSIYINSGSLDFNTTNTAGTGTVPVINLKGDITVAKGALITNNNEQQNGKLVFNGAGDGSTSLLTQSVNIASTGSTRNKYINFNIGKSAYVQLADTLELGTGSQVIDSAGATLDFGFNGTSPQIISIVPGATTNLFKSIAASTLKITSPDGVYQEWDRAAYTAAGVTLNTGNVQGIPKTNRSISPTATFWYIGKANQKTGDAPNANLSTSGDGKVVICDLAAPGLSLTPSVSFGVTNALTVNTSTGGKLDIRRGQFTETETEYIYGSDGTLYMAPGTLYKIMKGSTTAALSNDDTPTGDKLIPRMDGTTYPYVLQGGTIELGGNIANNYFQTLRGTIGGRPNYQYLKFSGTNAYDMATHSATNYKNLSSNSTVDSSVYVTGSAVVDCINSAGISASFDGAGGLVMDGSSRFRMKKLSTTPELTGVNVPYSLTGSSTVEYYGSSATGGQNQIRSTYGSPTTKITYNNIDANATAANWSTTNTFDDAGNVDMSGPFHISGTLNVFAPAVFRMDIGDILDGTGKVNVNDNAGLLYANLNGLSATGSSTNDGAIQTTQTDQYSSNASYGFLGNGDMVTGPGLPATTKGLYTYKKTSTYRVSLTNTVRADSILKMSSGHIITGTNLIELGSSTSNLGTLDYTTGYVIGKMRRWLNGTNSGTASGLFPMGQDTSSNLYNRHYYIQFTSAPSSGGALDVNFNNNNMGLAGLPIANIPAVGTCTSSFNVTTTEDQGYWVGTPQNGALGDGTYTLAITGENFKTITDLCQLTLLKRVGAGNWTAPGNHLQPTGNTSVATVSRSGLSGFSNFGFGGGPPNPLPVELTSFTGNCSEEGSRAVLITWATASERNSKQFILQRSPDGTNFINIATLPAAGYSNIPKHYSFVDSFLSSGNNYYRLREVDNDGAQTIYSLIETRCSEVTGTHIYYSQPKVMIELNSTIEKQIALNIFDVTGKLLHHENKDLVRGYNKFSPDLKKQLADGLYIIELIDGSNANSVKIFVHN